MIDLVETSIRQLREALESGQTTAVELVQGYLARIEAYDSPHSATRLNSVVVPNPEALVEAAASDERRRRGETRGPLDGIPYTAKDSYLVAGLTAAAGSPAFRHLRATRDAFTISRLRDAGAICLGKTTMPPMANGGTQRGVYGRAESPYNRDYLTAPFASGSSNGAGTATAASFAAFGLAEETWSSGRGPASNNALCAYTPSRGIISVRGNWPLTPTMDVVVPYSRSMADLLEILDVIVADDPDTRGDLWRLQPWVPIPRVTDVRPASYPSLHSTANRLRGIRFGVPKMYINADAEAGTGTRPGIGGPAGERIITRESIMALWEAARHDLESAGAEVVEVDFPVISNYEGDRPGSPTIFTRDLVSPEFLEKELWDLTAWAFDDFLRANADPSLERLAEADGAQIYPHDPGTLPNREGDLVAGMEKYVSIATAGITPWDEIAELRPGLEGLEETRRLDLEKWMRDNGLDAVIFPAVADVGAADSDVNPAAADLAWRNGVWVANGNLAIRHLGIPTVTVPLGIMGDIRMPVGLTFAGAAYTDASLLQYASAFESIRPRRATPPLTPELDG
ncbi:amidase [Lacisediminihabitans changchengi]|uniref:Amidase n=1 Tax=Lacisediminihabitans changchengi TaxID=2787634 RepID=A0A934SLI1_9MICO|nr:amidase [Lacisediminihabitans changchengi]MBK4348831.1 amidase [Lacisediminihabitans changchengi]